MLGKLFQSPLHRGNHFNEPPLETERLSLMISVPSSSGKSLQRRLLHRLTCQVKNFSPLFIGEITSTPRFFSARSRFQLFQSPLHRGNHFNDGLNRAVVSQTKISVPSSSGKSLQPEAVSGAEMIFETFQSPLHRGNHFNDRYRVGVIEGLLFQSPLHRGNHFNAVLLREKILRRIISVPSSSGKSLQPRPEYSFRYIPDNFSPLFIGE